MQRPDPPSAARNSALVEELEDVEGGDLLEIAKFIVRNERRIEQGLSQALFARSAALYSNGELSQADRLLYHACMLRKCVERLPDWRHYLGELKDEKGPAARKLRQDIADAKTAFQRQQSKPDSSEKSRRQDDYVPQAARRHSERAEVRSQDSSRHDTNAGKQSTTLPVRGRDTPQISRMPDEQSTYGRHNQRPTQSYNNEPPQRNAPSQVRVFVPGDRIHPRLVEPWAREQLGRGATAEAYRQADSREGYLITAPTAPTKEMITQLIRQSDVQFERDEAADSKSVKAASDRHQTRNPNQRPAGRSYTSGESGDRHDPRVPELRHEERHGSSTEVKGRPQQRELVQQYGDRHQETSAIRTQRHLSHTEDVGSISSGQQRDVRASSDSDSAVTAIRIQNTPGEGNAVRRGSRLVLRDVTTSQATYPPRRTGAIIDHGCTADVDPDLKRRVDNLISLAFWKELGAGGKPEGRQKSIVFGNIKAFALRGVGPVFLDLGLPSGSAKDEPFVVVTDPRFEDRMLLGETIVERKRLRDYAEREILDGHFPDAPISCNAIRISDVTTPPSKGAHGPRKPPPVPPTVTGGRRLDHTAFR
ncbi:uncharacterized protein HMPREF1541_02636 [Cyphellophora europaea CBS 101466]|uniref:Uncharacterized protein n=1 Tax=Cyphellophora europaea (strain CBS 101466) TaxID=1220924 RepID=W2S470_CYPE1|nr:uncharacterized protein HMPREF1541_02636 [Cyphellophora europaea CBS 101466]ETN43477.1 hypothetical protein HMPREF1541_02636 [Cyphellophora europaea CBS 101466]